MFLLCGSVCVFLIVTVFGYLLYLSLSLSLSPVSLYPPPSLSLPLADYFWLLVSLFFLSICLCVATSQQSACVLAYIHVCVRVHTLRLPSWQLLLLLFGLIACVFPSLFFTAKCVDSYIYMYINVYKHVCKHMLHALFSAVIL